MGDLESRQIAAATPKFIKKIADGVMLKTVEYNWLDRNDCILYDQSGRGFEWRFRSQRGTPIGFLGSEGLDFTMRNDFQVASLGYRGIADGIAMSWQEKQECKGDEAIFNLGDELGKNLKADLYDALCTDFYLSGSTRQGKTIQGLAASIGAAQTYAGLSQSTYTAWMCQRVAGTGFTTAPLEKLNALKIACSVGAKGSTGRNDITIFLMSATEWQTVVNFCQVQQQFVNVKDEGMLKAGFGDHIVVHGVPATWSNYCPTGTIYGLNPDQFKLRCTTKDVFEAVEEKSVGMPIAWLYYAVSHMNLQNENPRCSGEIYSIT